MLSAHKYILFFVCLWLTFLTNAQSKKKLQLEKEQKLIENRIEQTKKLLSKTENDLKNRTIELRLIEKNLELRERLVRNIDQQIRSTEQRIIELQRSIKELDNQTNKLKEQYRKMIFYAYKNRSNIDRLMFIFSSENFNQANKRVQYLRKINEVRLKQVQLIRSNQERMLAEQQELQNQKLRAIQLAEIKKQERETLLQERLKQQEIFNSVKSEESALRAKLVEDEKNKLRIQKEIKAAIEKEVEEENRKRKEEQRRRDEEARKQREQLANNPKNNNITPPTRDPELDNRPTEFGMTPEAKLAGNNFASNKGRLPYPVAVGTVVEKFGRNAHPTIANVYTENNGVDISTNRGAEVRAVFEGEVSSIIFIPGAGKAVILSHGNYRTVYANLQDVYVTRGSKLNHKQLIGSLLPQGNISILHFEIHLIHDNGVQKLNPELWLSK
jgi:septal ring factor EnvC (AmiA/AmiB activator)